MTDEFPEHTKLTAVKDKSQTCGEFIEWLRGEKGIVFVRHHEHGDACAGDDGWECGLSDGDYEPFHMTLTDVLAEFFEIDQTKLDNEKRAMLDAMNELRAKAKKVTP